MEIVIAMLDAGVTLAIVLLAMVLVYMGHRVIHGIRAYFRFRGTRLVTCPETQQAAVVELAAKPMGMQAILGESCLQLSECSRWPMRGGCEQNCLSQIAARESELRFRSRLKHSPYYPERT